MNKKHLVVTITVVAALSLGLTSYNSYAAAEKAPATKSSLKIAVVNLREIFQKNTLNDEFKTKLEQEGAKATQEVDAASKQVEALKAQMKTRTVGSNDYLSLMSQALEQQGIVQAKKEYYQQYMDARQQRFTEDLYTKIKEIIADYAAKNNVDLVLVKDDIQFPAASPNDLMLALSTRKVLYSAPEMDITDTILAAVNATKTAAAK
jgi:Skp family chaperone for outer membrane proteins